MNPLDNYNVVSFDFGATKSRVFVRKQEYGGQINPEFIFSESVKTMRTKGPVGHECEDVDGALNALLFKLRQGLPEDERALIKSFSISAHGSSNFICIDRSGSAVFGTTSYDHPIPEREHALFYEKFGSPDELYLETGTPNLPNALNWAKMIFHHKLNDPERWGKVEQIVPLSAYVVYRLCGNLASERTQTHNHGYGENHDGSFSKVIKNMEIEHLFPPFKKSYEPLGTVSPQIADAVGCQSGAVVNSGGHDSSIFALAPELMGFENAVMISSGTWDVVMALRGPRIDPSMQKKGLLYNVTVENKPLRTVLFRAGDMRRKYIERYNAPADAPFSEKIFEEIISSRLIVPPAYMNGLGPFQNSDYDMPIDPRLTQDSMLIHGISLSLALQRVMAVEIAGSLEPRSSLSEIISRKFSHDIVVGGKLAERQNTALESLRRVVDARIFRLDFDEPTSVSTHILGVCAAEGIAPRNIKSRLSLKAEEVTFDGDRNGISKYAMHFENLTKS